MKMIFFLLGSLLCVSTINLIGQTENHGSEMILALKIQDSEVNNNHSDNAMNQMATLLDSTSNIKTLLDSSLVHHFDMASGQWLINSKYEYFYDNNRKLTLQNFWIFNKETNKLELDCPTKYDTNGNVKEFSISMPNYYTGVGLLYDKYEFQYNENGLLTKSTITRGDGNPSNWKQYCVGESEYDSAGNETQNIKINTNSLIQHTNYKTKKVYDTNNKLIEFVRYSYDDSAENYIPVYKYKYILTENGNDSIDFISTWDSFSNSFIESSQTLYFYDSTGKLTHVNIKYPENEEQKSLEFTKFEYYYDEYGNKIMKLEFMFDKPTSERNLFAKTEFAYDNFKNLIIKTIYSYNFGTNNVELVKQIRNVFNYSCDKYDFEMPGQIVDQEDYFNQLIESTEYKWNSENNSWDSQVRVSNYYSPQK